MIKYITFDAIDEYGSHVTNAHPTSMVKTASSQDYSPEVKAFLKVMKREPGIYYTVINAMGTYEAWGFNKRGDAFPREGLTHVSLQSDMGTENDYGYKTFEYYAKLYRHHVNKDPNKSFGPVLFSHYNPAMQRVELVTGIRYDNAADLIAKVENGENFAVSMGCRVRYDRCSICGNKAKTRKDYCKHLSDYMKVIIDSDLAKQWSIELGRTVLPGSAVFAYNDHPRFFDISYVDTGADSTAFLLGKAASAGIYIPSSAIEGELSGVTDADLDKLASLGKAATIAKRSDIDKRIGPSDALDIDGSVVPTRAADAIKKAVKSRVEELIARERRIPNQTIDQAVSKHGLAEVLGTMLGLGIHPSPEEFQRAALVADGHMDMANVLDRNNVVFDYTRPVNPVQIKITFCDSVIPDLLPCVEGRSVHPLFLMQRLNSIMSKTAGVLPNDYWFEQSPHSGSLILQSDGPWNDHKEKLSAIAAIYAGLKLVASGLPVGNSIEVFSKRPWMGSVIAGGTYQELLNRIKASDGWHQVLTPTYSDAEMDNSALFKSASDAEAGFLQDYMYNPAAYVVASYNRKQPGFAKSASLWADPMNPRHQAIIKGLK